MIDTATSIHELLGSVEFFSQILGFFLLFNLVSISRYITKDS